MKKKKLIKIKYSSSNVQNIYVSIFTKKIYKIDLHTKMFLSVSSWIHVLHVHVLINTIVKLQEICFEILIHFTHFFSISAIVLYIYIYASKYKWYKNVHVH